MMGSFVVCDGGQGPHDLHFRKNTGSVTQVVEPRTKFKPLAALGLDVVQIRVEVFPFPLLWRLLCVRLRRAAGGGIPPQRGRL